ncbi:MAG: hypothetical protein K8T90_08815 [Planctomycetes bacterium]|nr:hypothetical protein [Planctomycetota bacterium]
MLKGAMLLAAWGRDAYRATNDVDFHSSGDAVLEDDVGVTIRACLAPADSHPARRS